MSFTSHTAPEDREALLTEYARPDSELRVLVSVEALAKGFDVPDVGCVIDCRPLRKSLSTAIQMWGRGLRISPETGKRDCLLLDHSGNIRRFQEDFEQIYHHGIDALDKGEKLDREPRKEPEKKDVACPKCGHKPFVKICIHCGHESRQEAQATAVDGKMVEITLGGKRVARDERQLWEQCVTHCRRHGKPETIAGRAAHGFRSITGHFPPYDWNQSVSEVPDVRVPMEVIGKFTATRIAYSRARNRRAA